MNHKYLFVVGIGRSGTSLIQSILHSHSSIHFSPETHFIKRYLSKVGTAYLELRLLKKIERDKELNSVSSKIPQYLKEARKLDDEANKVRLIFERLLSEGTGKEIYLGDKDPMNVNYLGIIKKNFPDSKVLHIIRDPRDVILSRIKTKWGMKHGMAYHCAEYLHGIIKSRGDGELLFNSNYKEIKYEDILNHAEITVREVCKFLDLPFETSMLNYEKGSKDLLRENEGDWKSNISRPLMKENTQKWKKEFNDKEIEKLEFVFRHHLQALGYSSDASSRSHSSLIFNASVQFYLFLFSVRFGK
ncbi:MAG: sulfotransferase [Cytophagales bacterium]